MHELGVLREFTEQYEYDAMLATLRDMFDAAGLADKMAIGAAWNEDQSTAEAMSI